ncbi:TPA: HNH endonuclease [Clostridioides difficile]|uniref:HNH endonuclease n=1 Tax=Clostridioides sp. ZZV14-5902 TaxID=2811486 RepID=UPI001C174D09|nr:HNH endonuclease [Clostridioides difficile]MCC0738411.1 HNH endonuclease [Clostridioides sp. ZZV14-5902]HBG3284760.1 HNH endonuclease [Clostridioides difficile]HCU2782702.1 HNH endonuclease [Clostridioides difficile]HEK4598270.1 HNH endonuclease [Clostridioides difficile]
MAIKKFCARCGKIISYGNRYCDTCQSIYDRHNRLRYRDYNLKKRNKEKQLFYNSKEWKSISKVIRNRDKGLCLLCLDNKRLNYYDVVHHVVELEEDRLLALSKDNLLCLCHNCHNKVHSQYKVGDKKEVQDELRRLVGGTKKVF